MKTAVINKRAGGMGLISGRKAFQRPMKDGVGAAQRHPGRLSGEGSHDRVAAYASCQLPPARVFAQRLVRAAEREVVPRDPSGAKNLAFEALVIARQRSRRRPSPRRR